MPLGGGGVSPRLRCVWGNGHMLPHLVLGAEAHLGASQDCPVATPAGTCSSSGASGRCPTLSKPKGQLHRDHLLRPVSSALAQNPGVEEELRLLPLDPAPGPERSLRTAGCHARSPWGGPHGTEGSTAGPGEL